MKFCEKCGKELLDEAVICVGCGCPVEIIDTKKPTVSEGDVFEKTERETNGKMIYPIIALGLWLVSTIIFLFVHTVVGIVMLFGALAFVFPLSVKTNRIFTEFGIEKAKKRTYESKMRKQNKTLKVNYIATIIISISLILFGVGIGIADGYKSSIPSKYAHMYKGSYGYGFVQQMDDQGYP